MQATAQLSPDQAVAAAHVKQWIENPTDQLTLGGYAGTGKTTILNYLWPSLQGAQAVAPTGKAAHVLKSKGINAVTVHRLLYLFRGVVEDDDGREQPVFDDRDDGDWGVDQAPRMIVCDEASMVNQQMYDSVMARGVPVLWVGDHGQLAPIGGDPGIMTDPDIRLEKIHRQAGGNPILRLAQHVRDGGSIDREWSSGDRLKVGGIVNLRIPRYVLDNAIDQVIVATNKLRHAINKAMRETLGHSQGLVRGDRLICTSNDYRYGMMNGQIFLVDEVVRDEADYYVAHLREETPGGWSDDRREFVRVQKASLGNPNYRSADRITRCAEMDWGWAITCHKSQGSSWRRVMVVDQNIPAFDMPRWRYTAVTRPEEHLTVVMRG